MTSTTTEPDTRPLLTRARAAVPGFTAVESAIGRVDARTRALPHADTDAIREIGPDVLDDVLAGAAIDSLDLGARAIARTAEAQIVVAERAALDRLRAALVETQVERIGSGADSALAVIRHDLDELLAAARATMTALGRITTAEAAIDADRATEWRDFREHAARYSAIRGAQRSIVLEVLTTTDAIEISDASAGTEALIARERRAMTGVYGHLANAAELVTLTGEHRSGADRELPWLHPDPLAALSYVLSDQARPWVPTMAELVGARLAHDRALSDAAETQHEIAVHGEDEARRRAIRRQNARNRHGMYEGDLTHLDYERH